LRHFLPCLTQFNNKRQQLLKTTMLLLDESISGWRPRSTKLGGFPNITYEPRKPKPLGTVFKNGVECISGVLVAQDVIQLPEQQSAKSYNWLTSVLPDKSDITAHTAEVLQLVERAQVLKRGWVGGDSWFGSIATAVEVYKHFGVHFSWIIKQNQSWFPKKALLKLLKAWFKERPAGHWVVFKTTIAEVTLFSMAYAWSLKGFSFLLSTCGLTEPSANMHRSYFQDDFGTVSYKEIK